ncbi:MAG: hypothetical protein R6V55_07505 [Desulfovermiculus sp.]
MIHFVRHSREVENPEQIEKLFSRLPGEFDPVVFEGSGPGND